MSCYLSCVLDNIGYGQRMVDFRRDAWQKYADTENEMKYHAEKRHLILAGSKAEGIASFYESDTDHLFVLTEVVCAEEVESISDSACLSVFQTDINSTPPGYTKLKLERLHCGRNTNLIRDSLFRGANGHKYISSSFYMTAQQKEAEKSDRMFSGRIGHHVEPTGPALPVTTGCLKADMVSGYFYKHPKALQVWSNRRRQYHWPPADIIEDISKGHGQIVPIGCHGSDSQFQEWRICFIDSELKLLISLNCTQIKLYILLKLVAKTVLKDVSPNVTSYILKNVCFWMAELLPAEIFREDKLAPLLLFSLKFLHCCINLNCLPYYMIPERNLLAGKFKISEKRKLSSLISQLLSEGPCLIQRCPKIRDALYVIYGKPELLSAYSMRRNELEILKLCHMILALSKQYGADTSDSCNILRRRIADVALPGWKALRRSGADVNVTVIGRMEQFLS